MSEKSWLVSPREPFNSRIWNEIAAELSTQALLYGTGWAKVTSEGSKLRITAESPSLQKDVE